MSRMDDRVIKCRKCGTRLAIEADGQRLFLGRVTYTKAQELPCGKCGYVTPWHPHKRDGSCKMVRTGR